MERLVDSDWLLNDELKAEGKKQEFQDTPCLYSI